MLKNDLEMFSKWFFYVQQMIFTVSKWLLHVQQMIFTFNKKFIYSAIWNLYFSNMRFIFNNLRFAFNEMKFIKLKSFTFSKQNLDVTKYTSKRQSERSGSYVVHPVCKYFLAFFERSLHITVIKCKEEVLCFFLALLVKKLIPRTGMGVGAWLHACRRP